MEKRVSKVEALPRLAPEFRVAAYARVSSEKDAMRHSLSAQVSYYSNLIQSHPGWQYAGVYADEPISGTKDCREEFQRMLSDCRAGSSKTWASTYSSRNRTSTAKAPTVNSC